MELSDTIKMLRDNVSPEIAKYVLLRELLEKYLLENPIDIKEVDLNPHLNIKFYCQQIADQVNASGFPCASEDVMLLWLTIAVYDGKLLPPYKEI